MDATAVVIIYVMVLLAFLLAFFVSLWAAYLLSRPTARLRVLDHPNERSLHQVPTPRTGGLAICLGSAVGGMTIMYWGTSVGVLSWIAAGALLVAVVSFLDDYIGLGSGVRLLVHLLAAGLLLYGGLSIKDLTLPGYHLEWAQVLGGMFALLFVVWMLNLYNFMDGMDGFAGGMAVIGFGTFGALGWLAGDTLFMNINWVIAGAAAGFLVWNFPPARIFMGDTGSSTLGYLAGGFTLWADQTGVFPWWVGVLVFSPFVVDATVTLIRRMLRGERVWQAHKTHYYQRLVQLGWGHRRTVLREYGLMTLSAVSALMIARVAAGWQWLMIGSWVVLYALLMRGVSRLESRQGPAVVDNTHVKQNT